VSIFRSPFPDIEVPDQDLTGFVLHRAGELGDKPAVIDAASGQGYTYAELATAVDRLAAGLAERGLGVGDVIALMSPNIPEFPIVFLGALRAGVSVTTPNPLYQRDELAHQLRDSRARLLFTVAEQAEKAQGASEADGVAVDQVVIIDDPDAAVGLAAVSSDGPVPHPSIDPAVDIAALPYSSGTTGLPKGVMLTHRNLVANVLQTHGNQKLVEDDVVLAVLPFFHIYGMTVTMNYCLWMGATVVTTRRYDPKTFPAILADYGVTRLYAAPPIILNLAKSEDLGQYDLSKLRGVLSGAAPLDAETAAAGSAKLRCRVTQGYGMTELSPCSHLTTLNDTNTPAASIGPALASTECKIVDPESGRELGPDEPGELLIRGPQVMRGYLNNEEATRSTIDEDGFLHTGDLAKVDANGYYYILDRLKELIKFKGFQIAPAELEAVVVGHEAVLDAAVIGVQDPEAGEIPKALVVTSRPIEAQEIIDYVAGRVAPHKKVRQVEFIDAIPKSASGKILRRELRDRERQATV